MDIGTLFDHEALVDLDLRHPVTEKPLGITFKIRSPSSDAVKKVARKHLDEVTERRQRGKLVSGEATLRQTIELMAAHVAGWDWGSNTYKGAKPEFSPAKVFDLLDAEDWIYAQVAEKVRDLANFTKGSEKPSAKSSG